MPTAKRYTFVTGQLGAGGAERQLLLLTRSLVRQGAAVDVVSFAGGRTAELLRRDGARVRVAQGRADRVRLLARAAGERPDRIVSWNAFVAPWVAPLALAARVPHAVCFRSSVNYERSRAARRTGWIVRRAGLILVNSELAVRELAAAGRTDARLLANAVDLEDIDRRAAVPGQAPFASVPAGDGPAPSPVPVVVCVANLHPVKRLDRFVDTIADLVAAGHAVRGVLVGEGPERGAIEARAAARGLSGDQLVLTGARDDVPWLLTQAAVLMLTSEDEGAPNALLEAMCAGLAFVSTPVGDARVLAERSGGGTVVDPAGLVGAVASYLTDPQAAADAGRRGRAYLEREHDLTGYAARFAAALSR